MFYETCITHKLNKHDIQYILIYVFLSYYYGQTAQNGKVFSCFPFNPLKIEMVATTFFLAYVLLVKVKCKPDWKTNCG